MVHCLPQAILAVMIYVTANDGVSANQNFDGIFLRLYTGATMGEYVDRNLNNASMLLTNMDNNKPTMLYIHGFSENLEKDSVTIMIEPYLKKNDHNVIGVDYGILMNESYINVARNASYVGTGIAMALDGMVKSGLDSEKLHIIGHSVGGQIAGHVGRKVSFKVSRITGLDPAGPLFNILEPRLSFSDARFVDIIHTDYGFYGIAVTIGTVDFFPNRGRRVQPGCPANATFYSDEEFCSHHRSWSFYAESITNESAFLGVKCSSLSRFNSGKCNKNKQIVMGYATPNTARGSVYLSTAAESPFGLGEDGAIANLEEQN